MRLRSVLATVLLAMLLGAPPAAAQEDVYNGSQLWLRYVPVSDADLRERYRRAATAIVVENAGANKVHRHTADLSMAPGSTEKLVETSLEAARDELVRGLGGLLDQPVPVTEARPRRRGGRRHARELGDRCASTSPARTSRRSVTRAT